MRLSKSVVGETELAAVSKVLLEDGYLGMGSEVGFFEEEIAQYLGIPKTNVVCVNTGTSALHLSVEAVTSPGDEVLVPSLTFLSSFQAISGARAVPISCDVYESTLTLDLEDAEKRLTPRTKAIMPVHYASNPADLERLYSFADKYGLRVIEDGAHAFGCSFKGKKIGSFGDVVCFSFDGIKNITCGEGGAIVTSDERVLSIVKDARLLSIEKDSEKRYAGNRSWDFDVTRQGYRYHMSNIFAAIGRVQLKRLETEFAPKRKQLLLKYQSLLSSNSNIKFIKQDNNADITPHILPVRILNGQRSSVKKMLESASVPTGLHYKPNHLLNFYGSGKIKLPVTEMVYAELLTLPLHPELEFEDVEIICSLINNHLKK